MDMNKPNYGMNQEQGYVNNPNMQMGYNPNMQMGYNPNMQIGYNPNMQMGYNPNMQMVNVPMGIPPGMNMGMQPGMNMGMPEVFHMGNNITAFFEKINYMDALARAKSAYIKQKVELLEVITGCETKNRYNVFLKFPDGSYVYVFKCKEDSDWCSRNCMYSSARPFSMKVKWIKSAMEKDDFNKPLITFEKPYKYTCCCLGRPEMIGMNHLDNSKIGRIYDEFKCCDPCFLVYDEQERLKYKISGDCCQCGICCKSCGKCHETKFFIYEGNLVNHDPTQSLGSIVRKMPGLAKAMFTDADNFDVHFPDNATPFDKLMIIGATLMIDYTFFEDEGSDTNNHHNYYY